MSVTVASSISEMQSHRMLPLGVQQQQRALADGEGRLRADADEARLVLAPAVEWRVAQSRQRGPGLPAQRHELALVLADGAAGRRRSRSADTACRKPCR